MLEAVFGPDSALEGRMGVIHFIAEVAPTKCQHHYHLMIMMVTFRRFWKNLFLGGVAYFLNVVSGKSLMGVTYFFY